MYLLFYLHLTESLYQLTTQNKVLTITTLHQSSDNPATTRRSPVPNKNRSDESILYPLHADAISFEPDRGGM